MTDNIRQFPVPTEEITVYIDYQKEVTMKIPASVMVEIKSIDIHDDAQLYLLLEPYIKQASNQGKLEYEGTTVMSGTDILFHSQTGEDS